MNDLEYVIYTDGACLGNPGPGGWAAIIINKNLDFKKKKYGSELLTTNNRMELTAIIKALNSVPRNSSLIIFTDSKYVINGIELWITKWKNNNWIGSNKKKVKNKDLWLSLDELTKDFNIEWNWVKGHSGNENNELVDQLAREQATKLNRV